MRKLWIIFLLIAPFQVFVANTEQNIDNCFQNIRGNNEQSSDSQGGSRGSHLFIAVISPHTSHMLLCTFWSWFLQLIGSVPLNLCLYTYELMEIWQGINHSDANYPQSCLFLNWICRDFPTRLGFHFFFFFSQRRAVRSVPVDVSIACMASAPFKGSIG